MSSLLQISSIATVWTVVDVTDTGGGGYDVEVASNTGVNLSHPSTVIIDFLTGFFAPFDFSGTPYSTAATNHLALDIGPEIGDTLTIT